MYILDNITYAEIKATKDNIVELALTECEKGKTVVICGRNTNFSFLEEKILSYNFIGLDDYIAVARGKLYFVENDIHKIRDIEPNILISLKDSIICRNSLPVLSKKIKMFRVV